MNSDDHLPAAKKRAARAALWLVGATLVYNVIEAGIAVWAGTEAGSIALLGFGLDSLIEIAAAAFMLWQLSLEFSSENEERIENAERRVHWVVGFTFLALAAYVLVESILTLVSGDRPQSSLVGIVLAAVSLAVMPLLAWAKLRVAGRIPSQALRSEAKETLACAYLSFTLLIGLVLNEALGWWWADPTAALFMVPWLVWEGIEGLRGDE
jgi:divalent metal cation (Fe/Co/Zn/Cd) transporter